MDGHYLGKVSFFMIRNARMEDITAIHALLKHFSGQGLLLGRSLSALYDQIRDFKVYEADDRVAGVCALHVCWADLAEIRSLAISESHQHLGIGAELVKTCLNDALAFGISKVFTLTYQAGFFLKLGFKPIDKNELPQKIWADCLHCPQFPDCDEEALIWRKP